MTVTDPAGKWKTMTVDGFGNLVTVVEPNPAGGTFTTSYAYNAFNQLTTVTMPRPTGTQTRTFVYDTAGRLTSVTQPENGTTTYGYDSAGRLSWRRDAKQRKAVYEYDAYNRTTAIRRHYWNGSADVENAAWKTVFAFDSAVNASFASGFGGQGLGAAGVDLDVPALWRFDRGDADCGEF